MQVTTLASVIGYDKASTIAHQAMERDLSLKKAALQLGYVDEVTFDRMVDPAKMVKPYVATPGRARSLPAPELVSRSLMAS